MTQASEQARHAQSPARICVEHAIAGSKDWRPLQRHAAARLLSHTDTTVDPHAYNQIAALFFQLYAEWASSRDWWQKAIATGHTDQAPRAMCNLGVLEEKQGNLTRARHWYQQAIATGHTDQAPRATCNLGVLEEKQGNLTQPGLKLLLAHVHHTTGCACRESRPRL